jgi:hypothetical protein
MAPNPGPRKWGGWVCGWAAERLGYGEERGIPRMHDGSKEWCLHFAARNAEVLEPYGSYCFFILGMQQVMHNLLETV